MLVLPSRTLILTIIALTNNTNTNNPSTMATNNTSDGVINIRPVEPFETVPVVKGYTNKTDFN